MRFPNGWPVGCPPDDAEAAYRQFFRLVKTNPHLMWQVKGKLIDPGLFKPLEIVEILYDFDGPRTFTHRHHDGRLCLAHWCDADSRVNRFIVVPFTEVLIQKLKAGELSLSEALDRPCKWILDLDRAGEVNQAWSVNYSDIPADVLPKADTMLWPSLEAVKPLTN